MSAELPQLLDCRTLADELGVKRATALAIMRRLPKVTIEEHRKVFVRRDDVQRYLAERTAA